LLIPIIKGTFAVQYCTAREVDMKITAVTIKGLEEVLAQELRDLGAQDIEIMHRAVGFHGDKEILYKANFWLRTA